MSAGRVIGGGVLLILRLVTAGLFIWAAVVKLRGPLDFMFSIKGFKLLPEHMLEPLAFMVPWTELVCGAALIIGLWGRAAALVISAMLVVFMAAIVSVIVRPDISVSCGCFGDFTLICPPGEVGWCNVGQNVLLLAIALPVAVWGPGLLSVDRWSEARTRQRRLDENATGS